MQRKSSSIKQNPSAAAPEDPAMAALRQALADSAFTPQQAQAAMEAALAAALAQIDPAAASADAQATAARGGPSGQIEIGAGVIAHDGTVSVDSPLVHRTTFANHSGETPFASEVDAGGNTPVAPGASSDPSGAVPTNLPPGRLDGVGLDGVGLDGVGLDGMGIDGLIENPLEEKRGRWRSGAHATELREQREELRLLERLEALEEREARSMADLLPALHANRPAGFERYDSNELAAMYAHGGRSVPSAIHGGHVGGMGGVDMGRVDMGVLANAINRLADAILAGGGRSGSPLYPGEAANRAGGLLNTNSILPRPDGYN